MSDLLANSLCDNKMDRPTKINYVLASMQILIEKWDILFARSNVAIENGKNNNAKHFHLNGAVKERACMMKLIKLTE